MHSSALQEILILPETHKHREKHHNEFASSDLMGQPASRNMPEDGYSNLTAKPETAKQYSSRRPSTPPFYLLQGLYQQARQLNPFVFAKVKQTQQQIEDRVYRMQFVDRQKYLEQCYMKKALPAQYEEGTVDFYLRGMLSQVMWRSEQKVVNDIEARKMIVYKKKEMGKEDLVELEKMDQMRLIKIRQGELKSKLQLLNEKMEQVKYYSEASFRKPEKQTPSFDLSKIQDQLDFKSYGLDSTRTKIASDYVVQKRQQRIERSKRRRLQMQRQNERLLRLEQEGNYNKQALKKQKHDEVLSLYQKKKQQLLQQRQKDEKRQAQFMKFLEEYKQKKPIYKQKEQQYQKKYILPKEKQRLEKLKQIHLNHKPFTLQQMQEHEKNYIEKKAEMMAKREEQMRMILAQRHLEKKDHFKGHFHEIIESEDKHVDPYEQEQIRRQKRRQFGQKLKAQHRPVVDQKKKKQLQELVALTERKNKRVRRKKVTKIDTTSQGGGLEYTYEQVADGDPKKDGLKYLQFARRIGQRMKHKQQNSKKQEFLPKDNKSQHQKSPIQPTRKSFSPRKNLSQHEVMLKQRRHLNSWQQDLKSQRLSQQQKLERVLVKSMLLDGKAKNKEQLLRFAHFQDPLNQIKEKAQLDEHYISSIKAKVALLSMND